jgi:predicted O-methyltransferase YrrM
MMVQQLAAAIEFDRILETGAFRGTSTAFFAAVFRVPVQTVESNRRFHAYSSRRLAGIANVSVELGDSRWFLARVAETTSAKTEAVFIYLDAHWMDDLPLAEELRIIAPAWPRCVVMVDDFEVPGDSGYGYDDYGPDKALTEDYLPAEALGGWSLMYPSISSQEETGSRRGCCVLASPALKERALVPTLRRSRVF